MKGFAAGLFGMVAGAKAIEQASAGEPVCGGQDAVCVLSGEGPICCDGFECIEFEKAGRCQEIVTCAGVDEPCGPQEGDVSVTCCEGMICEETNIGLLCGFCSAEGESCGDRQCCTDLVCGDDLVCGPPVLCALETESCAEQDCCGDLTCLEDATCGYPPDPEPEPKPEPKPETPVYKLPDTGAGSDTDAVNWIAPAALGAAAAVIGSKLLKGEKSDA